MENEKENGIRGKLVFSKVEIPTKLESKEKRSIQGVKRLKK